MDLIKLPEPKDTKKVYLKELLNGRRSARAYNQKPISINDLSYIVWSSYGFKKDGGRVVSSAGALYPLEIYVLCKWVETEVKTSIPPGIYHYFPGKHQIELVAHGDISKKVANASLFQGWMAEAPCITIISCEYKRITIKYRERGVRYAHIEAGGVAQNLVLAAANMGLSSCIVGAFDDELVKTVVGCNVLHEPLLIIPIGYN